MEYKIARCFCLIMIVVCVVTGIGCAIYGKYGPAITMPIYAVVFVLNYRTFGIQSDTDKILANTDRLLKKE